MLSPLRIRTSPALVSVVLVVLVIAGAALWSGRGRTETVEPVSTRDVRLDVVDGPKKQHRVQIDLRLYIPAKTPAPAVMLAHGFGGDKNSLAQPARQLAERGFTVLTYSARGFGDSTGKIALNSPAYEVTDARQILDWLARQPEVVTERAGDPLVGVAGVSYGGALSLLLAGSDDRVDAIAPMMTYNDLTQALLPNAASVTPMASATPAHGSFAGDGVFKQAWANLLFATGTQGTPHSDRQEGRAPTSAPSTPATPEPPVADTPRLPEAPRPPETPRPPATSVPPMATLVPGGAEPGRPRASNGSAPATCGNFTAPICAAYTELAQTGRASPQTLELLTAASPKSVTAHIDIPTLLVQHQRDPLFGLAQADANARQIAAAGGRVKMLWYAGDEDGIVPGPKLWDRVGDWFAYYLDEPGGPPIANPGTAFEYQVVGDSEDDEQPRVRTVVAPHYPGVHAERTRRISLELSGEPTRVINPPGGSSTLSPGRASGAASVERTGTSASGSGDDGPDLLRTDRPGDRRSADQPGGVAVFRTEPVDEEVRITGVSQTTLSVASVPGQPSTGEAVLFARLHDVAPDGRRTPIGNSAAPMRVTGLPSDGSPVTVDVALPGAVHVLKPGHRLELTVTATNAAYTTPDEPAVHVVGLAAAEALSVPSVRGRTATDGAVPKVALVGIGAIVVLVLLAWTVAAVVRRYGGSAPDTDLLDTPLHVSDVAKTFTGDLEAVRGLSLRVERGQIVGLLGPNGAGKTTTLRMITGLVRPTSGEVRIFGHRVTAGAPALTRVGFFAEGAGLLPHLSGLDNLRSYWDATGRPVLQARFDEVLEVAGLGAAADRRVDTYAPGMKQRLGIARAMLGMPDLLVLDEPTIGLDPPQSREMRDVLRRYAATGRAVLLSSHMLGEVEHLCSHVVVMGQGDTLASGSVEDIVAARTGTTFRVDEPVLAAETLRSLAGIGAVEVDGTEVHADLAGHPTGVAVNALVGAGVSVSQVCPRHRLEDAFLELLGEERT